MIDLVCIRSFCCTMILVSFKDCIYLTNKKNSNLIALNDGGAIKGMDAREDGVYITYVPTAGADAVTKKM